MNIRLFAGAALLAAAFQPLTAQASTPASDSVTVPSQDGGVVTVQWTGTALPGSSGASSMCVPGGADDSHDIVLTVPDGTYNTVNVTAAFHVEWTPGTSNGATTDPDLVMSVAQSGTVLGSSDGSGAEENVTLSNPTAGTLSAIVCPFFASNTTAYKGTLTLTAKAGAMCINPPTTAKANAISLAAPNAKIDPEHSGLIDIDQFRSQSWNKLVALPTAGYEGRRQSSIYDRVLGTPTFLWASAAAKPIAVGALASTQGLLAASARVHLRNEAKKLKLTDAMIDQAEVVNAQYNGNGPAVVRLRQRVNGYEVYHRYLNVLLDRSNAPVATSGYFASGYGTPSTSFTLTAPQAIAKAWAGLGGTLNPLSLVLASTQGEYERYSLKTALIGSHRFEREPRARRMYYATADGTLTPAYYVELFSVARLNRNLSAYALVVSATDGSILHRENLKASDAGAISAPFSYRMFAETTFPFMLDDQPLGNGYTPFPATDRSATITRIADPALPRLVTLAHGPIKTNDAWLSDTATATTGNNVDACLDLNDTAVDGTISTPLNTCDPNALGDYRAAPSADHTFDYTATPDQDPSTAQAKGGAVVSLFYLNNWLHDWWYDHGFDEISGNAQTSNYGRGGTEGDAIKAQGQDASGRNNANMSTPADGSSPTMQQYLFDGPIAGEVCERTPAANCKSDMAGAGYKFSGASFGPTTYDVTGTAVLAADGAGASDTDGCGVAIADPTGQLPVPIPTTPAPPQLSLAGNIALVDRGSCNFTVKEQFASISGASALVVINNVDSDPISMGNADVPVTEVPVSPTDMAYQTPAVMIRKRDGDAIKALLAAGKTVTLHVQRVASIDRDGTLDNQVVGHEFFHYVHHRLTDSTNQQANAMSEGWGDTDAMMISVRESDLSAPDNDHWQGAYDLAGYVIDNFYNGIRRAPYSTDAKKNAFTLKHIADGTATPDGGAGASNSEVHNAGEIWANEMWNCYAGILNTASNGSFGEKQLRMQDYIIGGFKMTPADATYTEARDAIIGTVLAGGNFADYKACSDGFAAKGNGLYAVAPARDSTDLTGVTEDYTPFVCAKDAGTPSGSTTGSTTGATTGTTTSGVIPPVTSTPPSADGGSRLGGGAFGLMLLIPGFLLAAGRRRRR
jgi:hypothetical protein